MGTPYLDDDGSAWLGDTAGLAKRRDHVVGEEKRCETGYEVERVGVVGERFHVADAQVCFWDSSSRQVDEGFGCVETEGFGAAVCDKAQEGADAATDVEHTLAWLERNTLERRVVARKLLVLAERPIVRPGSPERPPTLGASQGLRRRRHRCPFCRLRFIGINYGT